MWVFGPYGKIFLLAELVLRRCELAMHNQVGILSIQDALKNNCTGCAASRMKSFMI